MADNNPGQNHGLSSFINEHGVREFGSPTTITNRYIAMQRQQHQAEMTLQRQQHEEEMDRNADEHVYEMAMKAAQMALMFIENGAVTGVDEAFGRALQLTSRNIASMRTFANNYRISGMRTEHARLQRDRNQENRAIADVVFQRNLVEVGLVLQDQIRNDKLICEWQVNLALQRKKQEDAMAADFVVADDESEEDFSDEIPQAVASSTSEDDSTDPSPGVAGITETVGELDLAASAPSKDSVATENTD